MLHKAPNEGKGRERTTPHLLGVAITIAKCHAVVLHADDAVVRERHAEDVRGQLFECGCATPNRPAIHHPCLLPRFLCYVLVKIRLSQSGTQLRPKEQCQWLDRDQKCRIERSAQRPIWRERNRRHQIVDMRVKAQIPCPGLQHAQHANLPAKEARILGQLLKCCRGGTKEQGVDRAWLAPRYCLELGG